MNIEEYWQNFLDKHNLPEDIVYDEAFCFVGYSDEQSDRLLRLVLEGKKKATTSVYLEDEDYPRVGSYSVVLDRHGVPRCIIETISYRIMRFRDMTYEVAKKEGEDENLDSWIFNHSIIFSKECRESGYVFTPDTAIIFEEFEVVCIM